ncbi:hypothetical protein H0W26_02820 [Candidatus Dependentiae bacterium]|nr:hypothetical protein [Candidatus Dependentiae bacterium]
MKSENLIEGLSTILMGHKLLNITDTLALLKAFKPDEDISFEDFLLEGEFIDKNDLLQALSEYYRVPYCDSIGVFFDHYLVNLIPKDVLIEHTMIPYMREEDTLWVVAAEPNDPHLLVVLGKYVSHTIAFMVGLAQDILASIEEYSDESDTYQPNDIANQLMERSAQEVHTPEEYSGQIPLIIEETIDDYESK